MGRSPLVGLVRFHLRSTVRVALRNSAGQAVVVPLVLGLAPDPGAVVAIIAAALATGDPRAVAACGAWLVGNALAVRGPLAATARGWHRHLALGRPERRRAALIAAVVAQAPVVALALAGWVVGVRAATAAAISWATPAALIVLAVAAAVTAIEWQPRSGRLLGVAALAVSALGGWAGLVAGLVVLAVFDRLDAVPDGGDDRVGGAARPASSRWSGWTLPWTLCWRAVGTTTVLSTWFWAALALGCGWLFIRNNRLDAVEAAIGARVAGGLAVIAILLPVAGALRQRRPPWPWLRSLPWSSRTRILFDATFLAALCAPAVMVAGSLQAWALPPLAAVVAFQSVRLAGHLRSEVDGISTLEMTAIVEVWVLPVLVAAWPWLGWIVAAAAVGAIRQAARRERVMKVSLWRERFTSLQGESQP